MQIPQLQGTLNQRDFFIYAAADTVYFDAHARALINSVTANCPHYGIHIHIYNPRPDQIEFCNRPGVSCTYETLDSQSFQQTTQYWKKRTVFENDRQRQMRKKGDTLGEAELFKLICQTYYACTRFVRLAELLRPGQRCLELDVDGLVRSNFSNNLGTADFYLYEKPKDKTHLAGAILFNGTTGADEFLQQYANTLRNSIQQDDIYWFLDQVVLDQLVPHYRKGLLPMTYIDWAMRPDSAIWSAKGKRKELAVFTQEQRRYQ